MLGRTGAANLIDAPAQDTSGPSHHRIGQLRQALQFGQVAEDRAGLFARAGGVERPLLGAGRAQRAQIF